MNSMTSSFSETPKPGLIVQDKRLTLWELDDRGRPRDMEEVLSSLKLLEQSQNWIAENPEKIKHFFERLEISVVSPKLHNASQVLRLYQSLLAAHPGLFPHEKSDARWVTLKTSSDETVELEVPKNLLGMQSAYYHKLFTIGMRESQGHIVIAEEVSEDELKAFVEFLNTGQIRFTGEDVVGVLKLAVKNLMPPLARKCCEFIAQNLTEENLEEFLELAEALHSPDLGWVCYEFLAKHYVPRAPCTLLSEKDRLANLFSTYTIKFDSKQGRRTLDVSMLSKSLDAEALAILKKRHIDLDAQELICAGSVNEELQWLTLFKNLQGSTHLGLSFVQFEEVVEYVKNFRSTTDPPLIKRPYLRRLDLEKLEFGDEQFQALTPYLSGLEALHVYSPLITRLPPLPENLLLVCERCESLKKIDLPNCLSFRGVGCPQLEIIRLPRVTDVYLQGCHLVRSLDVASAINVKLINCFNLSEINVPQALCLEVKKTSIRILKAPQVESLICPLNQQLQKIFAPKALKVVAYGSMNLQRLSAPEALEVDCKRSDKLKNLALQKVQNLNANECPRLESLLLPEAINVDISYCLNLLEVDLPKANFLDCSHAESLIRLTLDEAKTIYAKGCYALELIYAPKANDLILEGCSKKICATIPETCRISSSTLNQENITRI